MQYKFNIGQRVLVKDIEDIKKANASFDPILDMEDLRLKFANKVYTISECIPPKQIEKLERHIPCYMFKEDDIFYWFETELKSLIKEKLKLL